MSSRLAAQAIAVDYASKQVLRGFDIAIPDGEFTVIVGPNACGKSTLLHALARLVKPSSGTVLLEGAPITSYRPKEVARRLSLLPQSPTAPEGIVVEDLVARGRYPHQGIVKQWTAADDEAVEKALRQANVEQVRDKKVSDLSGGQRQRVWLALVLAQNAPIVLLDEPTTYLDITHQVEVLNLAAQLHRSGSTVVAVLHELTLAFRYATHLIVMKEGAIVAQGAVEDIVTPELLREVYDIECDIIPDPVTGRPIVIPRG
ncbi:ABC transporter ATP-binding protein [Corynebacterium flavescens]|uniref:ABC transporter ATP-binding protein n=1 Tax=Corynebacterium flavescens TaxID=28028 RepID=UPI003F90C8B4